MPATIWTPEARRKRQEYQKRYRDANKPAQKARSRKWRLSRLYGISVEAWNELFASQGHCCAICKGTDPGNNRVGQWVTDHCHTLGHVRGILCHPCNLGLGSFKDNPVALRHAALYVTRENK